MSSMTEEKRDANNMRWHYRHRLLLRLVLAFIVIGSLALATILYQRKSAYTFNGLTFDTPELSPDFVLHDQKGRPFRLSQHQGELVLLYFGFTHCPDECPATLNIWKQVAKRLGPNADQITFVMISVDPERDTPEVIGEYLANFNPDFLGLSGPVEELEDIALDYNVFFKRLRLAEEEVMSAHVTGDENERNHEGEQVYEETYLVAHTTLTYLIDKDGLLILAYPLETSAQAIVSDLEQLIER